MYLIQLYINQLKFHLLKNSEATEVLPRNSKILRQYFESRRPKTELEQKIEIVLDFERNRLDKQMEKIFAEQDEVFKNKVDELLKKKK